MNRKQRIIVSITGIFIVLLALVGLTYAYFLTRITGNENEKSISVTTANLELVYGDGTTTILEPDTKLIPSSTEVGTKDFTVTNNGEDTSYTVLIEDTETYYATNGSYKAADGSTVTYTANEPTEFVSNDFRYTLTCTITSTDETRNGTSCNGSTHKKVAVGINEQKLFPINGGVMASNNIAKGDVHTYQLKFWYIDTGVDQSLDMNKTYQAKVNIVDIRENNPYAIGEKEIYEKSLAYNIINSAILKSNGTEFVNVPQRRIGESTNYKSDELGEVKLDTSSWKVYDSYDAANASGPYGGIAGTTCTDDLKDKYLFVLDVQGYGIVGPVLGCEDGKPVIEDYLTKSEDVLSVLQDDYGTSYYYRGNVKDNYVNFAGMCWRVVRIQGDGSIKLILEDQYATCNDNEDIDGDGTEDYKYTGNWSIGTGNFGYKSTTLSTNAQNITANYLEPITNANKSMVKAFYDFQETKLNSVLSFLKSGDWCLGDKAYQSITSGNSYIEMQNNNYNEMEDDINQPIFASGVKIEKFKNFDLSLNCLGTKLNKFKDYQNGNTVITKEKNMYVGTLTAEELVSAGSSNSQSDFYLVNDNLSSFWSLSLHLRTGHVKYILETYAYFADTKGKLGGYTSEYRNISYENNFRPAIVLVPNSTISGGEGTIDNPYIIR